MGISLCMIVKDEEESLESCLKSVSAYVDEIVIVDTGSKDGTKEIARKFTDRIYDFEWCEDFSKARNFSVDKASNDWILVMDGDETIISWDGDKINTFMSDDVKTSGMVEIISVLEDETGGIKKISEQVSRFFNRKYFTYEGIIHEQLVRRDGQPHRRIGTGIVLEHAGYSKALVKKKDKTGRNIKLLKKAISTSDKDPYLYYQLGKAYFMKGDFEASARELFKAMEIGADLKSEYMEDLVESYGYSLINTGRYKEALDIAKFQEYYSDSADYLFLLGLVYMNNMMLHEAVDSFISASGRRKCRVWGANSFKAFYNIGIIYECVGNLKEACKYYIKCGDYDLAKVRLQKLNL